MATKDILLRKKLIKESVLVIVVLVVLAGTGYGISSYTDDMAAPKNQVEGENNNLHAQHDAIVQDLGNGADVNAFYGIYFKNHNNYFTLNRESAAGWMSIMRGKHHLANLAITISPIMDIVADFARLKSNSVTKSDVDLTFGAIADVSIFDFVEALEEALPGIVVVKDLKFARTGDLSSNLITDLSQHKISPIVTGEITFTWLGLRPLPPEKEQKNPSQGMPNGQ